MEDFIFHIPTKILFGRGRETSIGEELAAAGAQKVLLVHGRGSARRTGLLDRVGGALRDKGIGFIEYGGVLSNPVISHTRGGIELARREKVDAVLAVGGGSVLDESKVIAAGAVSETDAWEFFIGGEIKAALPIFAILTLAATGSEMNSIAVVTNEETQQKYHINSRHIYPRVSILNPELTFTVEPDYSAYGAVDVIAHVIEAYFTRESSPRLQDRIVEAIILSVMETTEIILQKPHDYNARAEFMWAATLALNGITTAGVKGYGFPNHMIEHSLSALYNIPHGAGLSMVIPAWMRWYAERNRAQFERFAEKIFGRDDAIDGIAELERWFTSIKTPVRLGDWNIPAEDIPGITENVLAIARLWGVEKTYTRKAIEEILGLAI